nr:hypothetical protein [Desulfobacterales bacterium]
MGSYHATFKLMLLGGIGKRARRGFGSLQYRDFGSISEVVRELEEINSILSRGVKMSIKESSNSNTVLVRDITQGSTAYPRVKEIHLGRKGTLRVEGVLNRIGEASHRHGDNALGRINPRMASPAVATILNVNRQFYPVVTRLTSLFPPSLKYDLARQDDFINGVLQ